MNRQAKPRRTIVILAGTRERAEHIGRRHGYRLHEVITPQTLAELVAERTGPFYFDHTAWQHRLGERYAAYFQSRLANAR